MRYTIAKASRVPDNLNYRSDIFGAYFEDYWLAVAVCVLLTYCNPVGFTVTSWAGEQPSTHEVDVHATPQIFWNIGPTKFQQASVLVGQLHKRG